VRTIGNLEKAGEALKDSKKVRKAAARAAKTEEAVAEHSLSSVKPVPRVDAELPGRRGAFRQAKREAGIPSHQHPDAVEHLPMTDRWGNRITDQNGNDILTREYHYSRPGKDPVIIQEHSAGHSFGQGGVGDQGPHFNVRPAAPLEKRRTGRVEGTQEHYQGERPMNWHELTRNPKAISHLYDVVPPLHGMEVTSIQLNRDGPILRVEMDFPRFATHRPERWPAEWNTVAILLDFWGIQDLKLAGFSTGPVLDFSIEKVATGLVVQASGGDIQLGFRCDSIYIQKVTGYTNTRAERS
jgi:hypothetical protein